MGAIDFATTQLATTADRAFANACAEARYEEGHGGYTGTIAEKPGYRFFDLKAAGMTVEKLFKCLRLAEAAADATQALDWFRGTKRERAKLETAKRRAYAKLAKAAGNTQRERLVAAVYQLTMDKWGPAVCIEITGKRAKEYRQRNGLQGRRGKVYRFFGLASY